jgi:colanic acid biosynthesis protein WcaH
LLLFTFANCLFAEMLSRDYLLKLVDVVPLVAMDLVLVRGGTEILLGQRNNRPAQGFWFVPGRRIRKNEPMQQALERVARDELGLQLSELPQQPVHMGAFQLFYTDCFAGDVGVSTHYVVMGNLVQLPDDAVVAIADTQHSALRWWPLEEALASDEVHRFTKDYVDHIFQSGIFVDRQVILPQ